MQRWGRGMNFDLLALSLAAVIVAMILVRLTKASGLLKDSMIPQVAPADRTYSLSRTQMFFWFVVIVATYVYLFIAKSAVPEVSDQAVMLMGISLATAGGAVWVDAAQSTPEDALNDALKALGLSSYQDVAQLPAQIGAADPAQLAALNDKALLLQTYKDKTAPFKTQGLFRDLCTDINGTALHRLQAVAWTVIIGAIFVYEALLSGAMPNLSANLLALMGIGNAGYVGFKYNETQY